MRRSGPARLRRAGVWTVSAVLLTRGAGGLMFFGGDLARRSERFRRLDARYYSPLCLALGTGAAVVAAAQGPVTGYREPGPVA